MTKTRAAAALETKTFAFKLDAPPDEEGKFTGYAAVFGNVDRQNDLIEPGAFTKTLQENPTVPILWQHDAYEPIGVSLEMKEDDTGLRVEGQLAVDVQRGSEARSLMQLGAIKGLSIGYRAVKPVFERGVRRLKEVQLVEWSPVTFPANTLATIADVKGTMPHLKLKYYGLYDDDSAQIGCLLSMISAGTQFTISESDEGDTGDVAAMQSILAGLSSLLAAELSELGADDEAMSARLADIFLKGNTDLSDAHRELVEHAVKALTALLDSPEPAAPATRKADGAATNDAEPALATLRSVTGGMRDTARAA
jgi:HK97 family phage prohead protease